MHRQVMKEEAHCRTPWLPPTGSRGQDPREREEDRQKSESWASALQTDIYSKKRGRKGHRESKGVKAEL